MAYVLNVLQVTRLKGRATDSDIAAATGLSVTDISSVLNPFIERGDLDRVGNQVAITAAGRVRLNTLLTAERRAVDHELASAKYREFDRMNAEFKQLISDWQLIGDVHPNYHTDAEYDADVVARLVA